MRLRHIEMFSAVMLTGSVSGAARLINVTQPAVSRTLAHAELQLGFALFHRVKNRLVPTAEALALYPHVETLFANLESVQRLSRTLRGADQARELRVASILALGHEVLPRALKLFAPRYPKVAVTIQTSHSPQIVTALLLREADIGFFHGPSAHPGLQAEAVGQAHIVCLAPPGSLPNATVARGEVGLADLVGRPVIGLQAGHAVGTAVAQACRDAGVGLQAHITVQTYHAALALARHGLGIALVDSCTALSADPRELAVLRLAPPIPVPVLAARPQAQPHSVAARAFVRAVQKVLAQPA